MLQRCNTAPRSGKKYDRIQMNIFYGQSRREPLCPLLMCRCIQLIAIQYEDKNILRKDRTLELTVLMSHCADIADMI